ncbi:substrate-binding and VWA domain-containing protein [Streptomyces sp. NPDC002845]
MGRHSLPDASGAGATGPRSRVRRRTAAVATVLVLTAVAAAARGGLLDFGASCEDEAVRLNVAASPDIAPVLRAAADRVREDDIVSDDRCVDIRVTGRASYEVADALRSGEGSDLQVWVPDSDVWVRHVTGEARSTRVTPIGNVASSPVGVAVIPSAARTLDWPRETYTWTELAGAALGDGRLRLGSADPARSATGLLALTRLTTAAARANDGDTQAAALAKALSQRTVDSDAQVLATLPRDASGTEQGNPQRNQALFLSEQSAYTYNATADGGDRLGLFYPKDGSPRLDYPYALVEQAGLTTDERSAALRFMTLLADGDSREILARHGFRTTGDHAAPGLVTQAGGRAPQPYRADPAEPAAARDLQEALGMWTVTVQSARITTVVDSSGSMAQPVPGTDRSRMDVTKAALLQALATFTPDDEIGLWDFATKLDGDRDHRVLVPTERLGTGSGDGTQRNRLSAAFNDLEPVPDGETGLYDTTLAAYEAAVSSYAASRFNALVLLTDGVNQDPGSISLSALVTELRQTTDPDRPVPLIAIAVGPEADRAELDEIATATGGSAHQVTAPSQIHSVILKAITAAGTRH